MTQRFISRFVLSSLPMAKISLPIDSHLPDLVAAWKKFPSLIVGAAPGTGKTTRLPAALASQAKGKIWVLEPRRIAAMGAASRVAQELGFTLGKEVGYQVRFENRSEPNTKLLFLTEALLLRKLMQDPKLSGVECVVLDEFHERSIHVDLALAALKELQELERPDLKIVVMSATLQTEPLEKYLNGAALFQVPGKLFPLEIRYEEKSQLMRTGPDFTERMRKLILEAHQECEGDILVFLPGKGEIDWLERSLTSLPSSTEVLPLHGQLSLADQTRAIAPLPSKRKIILSTNVAESSVTVSGVRIVIDSGLQRLSGIDPRTGNFSLSLARISKASATQRAGRAAREGTGTVYRAWVPYDEKSMPDFDLPEIHRTDLSETILLLSSLGVSDLRSFSWFEPPAAHLVAQASRFLESIGAVDSNGQITQVGKSLRALPVHPRIGRLLLAGKEKNALVLACEAAAALSELSKKQRSTYEQEDDLLPLLKSLSPMAKKARDHFLQLLDFSSAVTSKYDHHLLTDLLLAAYPDRICRRRKPHEPQGKMAGGRGVKLHPDSSVKQSEFFLALDLMEGNSLSESVVSLAVGLENEEVEKFYHPLAAPKSSLEYEASSEKFWVIESLVWNELSVGKERRRPASAEEVTEKLSELALHEWSSLLSQNEGLKKWQERLEFLHKKFSHFPLLTEEQKKEALELVCYGENSLKAVKEKDIVSYFENTLTPEHRAALERECPEFWVVPSGSRIPIQYTQEQGALVEVRLQELFGLPTSPKIAGQELTLVLLAPNYRPVQVTRDLKSFWQNAYQEVRKDLRLRYPKHSWPDDPLTAAPQAKGRPRK